MRLMMWCVRFEKISLTPHVLWKILLKMMMWEREISVGVAVGGGVYVRNVRRSEERCEINEIKIAVGYENKYIHILEEIFCSRFIFLPPLCSSLHHSFASSSSFSSSSHAAVPMPPTSYDDVRYTREIIWLLRQDSTEHSTSHRCTTATNDASWSAWIQQQWIADLNIRLSLAHADGWSWCSSYSFFSSRQRIERITHHIHIVMDHQLRLSLGKMSNRIMFEERSIVPLYSRRAAMLEI